MRPKPTAVTLSYQNERGEMIVTDVLCTNLPPLTGDQLADLSWRLTQFFQQHIPDVKSQTDAQYHSPLQILNPQLLDAMQIPMDHQILASLRRQLGIKEEI